MHELAPSVDGGKAILGSKLDNLRGVGAEYGILEHEHGIGVALFHRGASLVKLFWSSTLDYLHLELDQRRGSFDLFDHACVRRVRGAPKHGDAQDPWHGVLQDLESLDCELIVHERQAGNVAAGM